MEIWIIYHWKFTWTNKTLLLFTSNKSKINLFILYFYIYLFLFVALVLLFCGEGSSTPIRHISLRSLIPNTDAYMTYEGSTTHPGCWESTVWIILNKPIYITKQEVTQYAQIKLIFFRDFWKTSNRIMKFILFFLNFWTFILTFIRY